MLDTTKLKYFGLLLTGVFLFALGRYTAAKPDIKASETVITAKDQTVDKNVKKQITETKKPDGTVTTVTTIDSNTQVKTDTNTQTRVSISQRTPPKPTLTLLGGYDFRDSKVVYGAHFTKPLVGPMAVGIFGLNNNTFGISLGLEF